MCPETSSKPGPRKNTTRDCLEGRTPGRWPGPVRRGRSGGCGPSRWAAEDPAAQNVHATISAARGVTRQVNKNARSAAAMVGDLVVAVVADAAPEQDVLCRADAGGDGVPDRGPQRESSPGGVYGTLLCGHGLASARFPLRVPSLGWPHRKVPSWPVDVGGISRVRQHACLACAPFPGRSGLKLPVQARGRRGRSQVGCVAG